MRENDKRETKLIRTRTSIHRASVKKDRKKFFRGTLQAIFLIFVVYMALNAVFSFDKYEPYNEVATEDNGFIAVSYYGAGQQSEGKLIGIKELDEHLKALKNQGYVTVTQQDIIDYYKDGKLLPERALYLMFEDSRSDTGVYANRLLEKHNLVATMLGYGDSFEERDNKFIKGRDLISLRKSGFWELGTNGYRFEYINVFEHGDEYVGRLTSEEYAQKITDVDARYNNYLNDYIRDENSIPIESYEDMKERIDYDYRKMKELYESETEGLPWVYTLNYSDELSMNDNARVINEEWIYSLFEMNFNRAGYSLNTKESSVYDLTRIQPKPHWSTNHLLMRIADDIKAELKFVDGDLEQKEKWNISSGVAEFKEKQIILTSTPNGEGLMSLKGSEKVKDLDISVRLKGNKTGSQSIYLRTDDNLTKGVQIEIIEDTLIVYELSSTGKKEITTVELQSLEGEYPELEESRNRLFKIALKGNKLTIQLDKEEVVSEQIIENNEPGLVYIGSRPIQGVNVKRGLADEIYDARFEDFVIAMHNEAGEKEVFFDNRLKGVTKWLHEISKACTNVVNWFIDNL